MQIASTATSSLAVNALMAGKFLDSDPASIADKRDSYQNFVPLYERTKASKYSASEKNHFGFRHASQLRSDKELNQAARKALKQAIQWIQAAAHDGDKYAQFNLGAIYDMGIGGKKQNYKEAFEWWTKSADQGLAEAQTNLGVLYSNGLGVEQDYAQAKFWFEKAADQGLAEAQYNLGGLYYSGFADELNYHKAFDLFEAARKQGVVKAFLNIGRMYYNGDWVKQDYKEATEYFRTAMEKGDDNGKFCLAQMLLNGSLGEIDAQEGRKLLQECADKGMKSAQFALEADLSPIVITEIQSQAQQGVTIRAKGKFELYPTVLYDEEAECSYYYLLDRPLGIRLWAETRAELIALLERDLDCTWLSCTKPREVALTGESLELKNLLLSRFAEDKHNG